MTKEVNKKDGIIIAPSILSASFGCIVDGIKEIEKSGAEWVHCDVMDGVFVPNITFGQKMIADIRKLTDLVLDVHLMITRPERYVKEFASVGADIITVHYEASNDIAKALYAIKECGVKAGLSIKPDTPIDVLKDFYDYIDLVLIMSVQPGFSGQSFIPSALDKLRNIKGLVRSDTVIELDGGVNIQNAKELVALGADALVMGNAFFKASDPIETVKTVKAYCKP